MKKAHTKHKLKQRRKTNKKEKIKTKRQKKTSISTQNAHILQRTETGSAVMAKQR